MTTIASHLGVMIVVSVVLGVVVSGLAIPFAGVLGFAARSTADTVDDLPQELETTELPQRTTIVDRDGNTIASIFDQNRENVQLEDVSRLMVKALLSIEDYRFYQHGALDIKGTLRAFVSNVGAGGVVQGGSSITQQLVKQTLLTQAGPDKAAQAEVTDDTYARKLKELRYAIALEKKHSKDWILERYLNTVYFGDGAYGVQAAARNYFNVNARRLDLNQAATLAGLVQNPSAFDPTDNPERAIERRNVVLDRMAELNVIAQERADRLKARDLDLDPQPNDNGCVNSRAPLFCKYVYDYLLKDRRLGNNEEEREKKLRSGGLLIRTTVDLGYQAAADQAVTSRVGPTDRAIAALALVEPGTGEVRAISQSRPFGPKKRKGETFLNYVVQSQYGDSNGFQAGSTFKAFTLAAAIEKGVPLNETIYSPDAMTLNYDDYDNCPGAPGYGYGTFPMTNSTTGGYHNLYTGTRNSVNTFYLQLEQETGVCAPYKLAKQMGVRLDCPEQDSEGVEQERVPNFTLGVADVSPLEMAEAYATFAARGIHCDAHPVTSIEDANGKVLTRYQPHCGRVMRETTADAVSDVLRGVLEYPGFAYASALDQPAAGKTGTTQSGRSVWFCGYFPGMAAAAMIAGANEFGTPISLDGVTIRGNYISGVTGSGYAAPIWGDAMQVVDDDFDYEDFVFPTGVAGAGDETPDYPTPDPPRGGPGRGNGNGNGNGNGGGRGR